jgi:hypothetical protein
LEEEEEDDDDEEEDDEEDEEDEDDEEDEEDDEDDEEEEDLFFESSLHSVVAILVDVALISVGEMESIGGSSLFLLWHNIHKLRSLKFAEPHIEHIQSPRDL